MESELLDELLEKLSNGDSEAAAEVFRSYEPYLRMVVRRQLSRGLRRKFDSADIVQSIWADLLPRLRAADWSFADSARLRAFLVQATRHRLIDRARRERASLAHEAPLLSASVAAPVERAGPPSAQVRADDLWEQMLALASPAHHELLAMKREGFSLDDIAQRTGLHKSSVRRVLYDLARRLAAQRQSGEPGESGASALVASAELSAAPSPTGA